MSVVFKVTKILFLNLCSIKSAKTREQQNFSTELVKMQGIEIQAPKQVDVTGSSVLLFCLHSIVE